MGADLYIRKITDPARAKYQPLFEEAAEKRDNAKSKKQKKIWQAKIDEFFEAMYPADGYFRDSYNSSSVLWTLGLSWWEDCDKLLNKNGNLSGKNLSLFIEMIENAEQYLPTEEELKERGLDLTKEGNSLKDWHDYYTKKREKLLEFLKSAKKNKWAVTCSI